jgi:Fur family ferric uptake transcriptional regulator
MKARERRITRQCAVILEELRKLDTHPTADELCGIVRRRLPRISLGTVYRNLDYFVTMGEIVRLDSASSSMRFDGNISGISMSSVFTAGGLPIPV